MDNATIALHRKKVIAVNDYIRKKRTVQTKNIRFHCKIMSIRTNQTKISRRQEIIKSKINKIKNKYMHVDQKTILLKK